MRLKHSSSVMPKAFGRWIHYVKMRKLTKRLLTQTENQLKPGKVDLHWAFNRWRNWEADRVARL